MKQTTQSAGISGALLTLALAALVHSGLATAQDEHPDFTGVWEAYASDPAGGRGAGSALTEQGRAMVEAFEAQFGEHYVEPGSYCVPPGLPATMTAMVSYPVEIIHSEDRITMLAEYDMQVRRIYMDGREFPENYPTTGMGYSIGHWEGDELVIETQLLNEYLQTAWPRTEDTRVVERIYRTTRDQVDAQPSGFIAPSDSDEVLVFDITVTDPVLYDGPQNITMYYQRIPDDSFLEYACPADLWRRALNNEAYQM